MPTIRFVKQTQKWQAIIRRQGVQSQVKTFVRKEEAIKWARQIEIEIDKGFIHHLSHNDPMVFKDIAHRYEREFSIHKKSYLREKSRLKCLINHFGKLYLNQINASKVALFRDLRLSQGLSGATVIKDLNTLAHIINMAKKEWGYYLPFNPVKEIRKPPISQHRKRRLSASEENLLMQQARKSRSHMLAAIIIFALETGMRLGEILQSSWNDIDNSIATIHATKNGESREVPLTKKAKKVIEKLPKNIATRKIFWNWNSVSSFQSTWQRLIKKTNISNLRFHDLRHEAISRLFEKGLNVMEVSTISGHKNLQVLKCYTHIKSSFLLTKINVKFT